MKKNLLSVSALFLSVISIVYLAASYSGLNFDFAPFLVAVLTLLTAILLGWQVYNYLTFEERIKKMREELEQHSIKQANNTYHQIKSENAINLCTLSKQWGGINYQAICEALREANLVDDEYEYLYEKIEHLLADVLDHIQNHEMPLADDDAAVLPELGDTIRTSLPRLEGANLTTFLRVLYALS